MSIFVTRRGNVFRVIVAIFVITFVSFGLSACGVKSDYPHALEGDYSLYIKINDIECCNGSLRLAVYHHEDFWLRDDGMVRGRLVVVQSETQNIEIHGLPGGQYAVAVFQDENNDGKQNRFLGVLPREPYGFSNNVGAFGPPSFDKAAIELDGDKKITIALRSGVF